MNKRQRKKYFKKKQEEAKIELNCVEITFATLDNPIFQKLLDKSLKNTVKAVTLPGNRFGKSTFLKRLKESVNEST